MPSVKVIVDDNRPVFVMFGTSANQVTIASGLSTSTHTVLLYVMGANPTLPDSWTGTVGQTHIQSLQFDAGSTLSAYPVIRSKNCFILGDSFLAGSNGAKQGNSKLYTILDPSVTWAFQLGYALDCEVGVVGVGGQGFLVRGIGGYPHLLKSWNKYDATHDRIFIPAPDFVIDAHGINDHHDLVPVEYEGAAVQTFITSIRSSFPATKLFLYLPVGGKAADEFGGTGANAWVIKRAVTDLEDLDTFLIDPGSQLVAADNWVTPTWFAPNDGKHPAKAGQAAMAAIAIQQMQEALSNSPIAASPVAAGVR
jgi:hypothetical protein